MRPKLQGWRIQAAEIEEGFLAHRGKRAAHNSKRRGGLGMTMRGMRNPRQRLFEALGVESGEFVVFDRITDLYRTAANFAIFDIGLIRNGKIQNHRDFFAAVRAHESMFHCQGEA